MAMTSYSGDPEVISKLGTTPQERGLETQQFKAKFDEGLKGFVEWFNLTHKTEFEAVQTDLTTHLAENVSQIVAVARDISITGDQIISFALSNVPKIINVSGMVDGTQAQCEGKATGISSQTVIHALADTGNWYSDASMLIRLASISPSYQADGKITAVSATSITINWAIDVGSVPTGTTAHLIFEFITH